MSNNKLPDNLMESGESSIKLSYFCIILFALAAIAYIPPVFTNPYFIHIDEDRQFSAAMGFLRTGEFLRWDHIANAPHYLYDRAWPHTLVIAAFYWLFGVSIETARAVSAVFGIIFILSVFHIINKTTTNKNLAFVVAVLLLFNPAITLIFRTIRMYAVMLPAAIWMVYFAYNFLTKSHNFRRDNKATRLIKKYIDFHYGYLLLTLIFIVFNFLIMPNSLVLGYGIILFLVYKCFASKEVKYKILTAVVIGLLGILIAVIRFGQALLGGTAFMEEIGNFMWATDFGGHRFTYDYFWMNITHPWGAVIGILLLMVGFYASWRYRKSNDILIFASLLQISTVLFFVFIADLDYVVARYMSFLFPITLLLMVSGAFFLSHIAGKVSRVICCAVLIIALVVNTSGWFSVMYINDPEQARFGAATDIIRQDAKDAGIDITPIFVTTPSYNYHLQYAGDNLYIVFIAQPTREAGAEIYRILSVHENELPETQESIGYVFIEHGRFRDTLPHFREFLFNDAEVLFNKDNVNVFKYRFISPVTAEHTISNNELHNEAGAFSFEVGNPRIIDGNAYHDITAYLTFDSETSGARFLSVRITEMVGDAAFNHHVQLLIPENIYHGQEIVYTISIRIVHEDAKVATVTPLNYFILDDVIFYPIAYE